MLRSIILVTKLGPVSTLNAKLHILMWRTMQLLSIVTIYIHSVTIFRQLTHSFRAILQPPWVCDCFRAAFLRIVCQYLQDLINPADMLSGTYYVLCPSFDGAAALQLYKHGILGSLVVNLAILHRLVPLFFSIPMVKLFSL